MNKILVCILLIILFFKSKCSAQKKSDSLHHFNNAVYFELGGPTLAYSIGYERTWYQHRWFTAISSVGFSYIPYGITMGYIEPGVLLRHKSIALEIGIAFMSYRERAPKEWHISSSDGSLNLSPRIGARFFTKNQRFHFRTGITPFVEIWNNDPKGWPQDRRLFFWLNVITIGYRF